ncbi:Uncharacterised protein [Mycobacteroides abscessus]|nr:Uncharacterised protein [Mycobacteroides abscessus]SKY51604.1 Uncharacterised protein [Mycobacteroides abscessus subsp. abscessus]
MQLVVAVSTILPRLATGSSPARFWAWSRMSRVSQVSRHVMASDRPIPRRSTATTGRCLRTSAPGPLSHVASWTEDGRSEPVVKTRGPASAGVCEVLARTAPRVTLPGAPLIGSSGALYSAHSSVKAGEVVMLALASTSRVQSCHDRSTLGLSIAGGPLCGGAVEGPTFPWPSSIAKCGPAEGPGAHPARTPVSSWATAITPISRARMPTTVSGEHWLSRDVPCEQVAVRICE